MATGVSFGGQTAAAQQVVQAVLNAESALQGRCLLALRQGGVEGQGDAGDLCESVEGIFQRAGGQVVAAQIGLLGLHAEAGQRRGGGATQQDGAQGECEGGATRHSWRRETRGHG